MSQEKQDTKPAELDACVESLIAEGYEEDRAYAICTAAQKKADPIFGYVKGYASIFGNVDRDSEVVDRGAFTEWLQMNDGKSLPYLWIHQRYLLPVGVTTFLQEDEKGLYYEAAILNTSSGQDLYAAIKSGAVDSASFAYGIVDQYEKDGIWHLSKLTLSEISAVTKGMSSNPLATVEIMEKSEKSQRQAIVSNEPTMADHFKARLRQFITNLEAKKQCLP